RAPAGPEPELAQGGRAGVVLDVDRKPNSLRERRDEVEVAKAGHVRREDDLPFISIDQPGDADGDRSRRLWRDGDDLAEEVRDLGEDRLGCGGSGGGPVAPERQFAGLVDQRGAQVSASKVSRNDRAHHTPMLALGSAARETQTGCGWWEDYFGARPSFASAFAMISRVRSIMSGLTLTLVMPHSTSFSVT